MSIEIILVCLISGIGAGLGTGFAGMSAAVVISPMLITFLNINPFEAIGIALASDVLASGVSAYNYSLNKNVDVKRSKSLFISILIFTVLGAILSHQVEVSTMGSLTLYATLIMGINFFLKSFKEEKPKKVKFYKGKYENLVPLFCGAIVGSICGFIGAGGGIMMLIILTSILGYELKNAVGTSVFIMTFTALIGSISHFSLQGSFPDFTILFLCVMFTFIFANLGSKFANKANHKVLNRATGIVLIILGTFMLISNYMF